MNVCLSTPDTDVEDEVNRRDEASIKESYGLAVLCLLLTFASGTSA